MSRPKVNTIKDLIALQDRSDIMTCKECLMEKRVEGGCYYCGGFRFVLGEIECDGGCGRKGWIAPRNITIYIGKSIYTFDGLKLTYTGVSRRLCDECVKKD